MAIFRCVGFFIYLFSLLKDSASLLFWLAAFFFTWSHSACFPSVGWVNLSYEVLLFVAYAIFGTVIGVFYLLVFCSRAVFLRVFFCVCFHVAGSVHIHFNICRPTSRIVVILRSFCIKLSLCNPFFLQQLKIHC
jgi:hypothetical protein